MDNLQLYAESLIFAAHTPITFKEIRSSLEMHLESKISKSDLESALDQLIVKYQSEHFSIEIVEISEGYTFMSKGAFHGVIGSFLKHITKKKLSKAALETLAIIAYKQPTTKAEMEAIRGVNCDYTVQKLLEKELVEIQGRSESIGKPLLYGTSPKFMDYFGLKNLEDLPQLKDIEKMDETIGQQQKEETVVTNNPTESN